MKIRLLFATLVLAGSALLSFAPHKHYISLTQIDYDESEKALQITMRFFIDDLEKAVGGRFDKNLQLATREEMKDSDVYIERYVGSKFKLWINGEPANAAFLGKQYEDDQVFFFLEISKVEGIETLEVQNSMLMEVFEEQQNYVKISIGDTDKTFILIKANDKDLLKIESPR